MSSIQPQISGRPPYFGWIDAMRGIAAICVVIFHYHQFYFVSFSVPWIDIEPRAFPYGTVLWPVFELGEEAVRLFWVISGFVFAHVYWGRNATLREFAVARFARLYPLHFVTLMLVALLQLFSLTFVGHWQIYGDNDLFHFVLHLFLMDQSLNFASDPSFNGPIWSVSAEIFVYVLFFAMLPILKRGPLATCFLLAMASFAALTVWPQGFIIGEWAFVCAVFFFAGSATFAVYDALNGETRKLVAVTAGLGVVAWGGGGMGSHNTVLISTCCAIVLALATLEKHHSGVGRTARFLGDISYSIYLVHVPIQMIVLIIADLIFAGDRGFTQSHITLPVYLATSIGVAYWVHVRFEKPAGRWVRTTLNAKRRVRV